VNGIEAALGRPEFKIPREKLLRAQGAIVYAWMREGRALYIGMSASGLIRPLSASHDVCWAFQPGDYLYIWKAKDREDARRLERLAIDLVGPAYNGSSPERPQRPDTDDPLFDDENVADEPATGRKPSANQNLTLFGALGVPVTELLE
jgi:hypothetical protein